MVHEEINAFFYGWKNRMVFICKKNDCSKLVQVNVLLLIFYKRVMA